MHEAEDQISFGSFRLDLQRRELHRLGKPVPIGARAVELLCTLVRASGVLVTKDELMTRVWAGRLVEENNIQAQVSVLRRALKDDIPISYIVTVPGRGYRFAMPATNARQTSAPRGNLHETIEPLIGRECDLAMLEVLLAGHRLVTLTGAGGIGKTRLALQCGANLRARFPDGIWLVELAPLSRAELVGETAAAVFSVSPPGEGSATMAIAEFIADKRLMLVLDNCEHVAAAAAQFAEAVLTVCPKIAILATSREPLAVSGEHVLNIPPLSVPGSGTVTAAAVLEHSSVQLFVARASSALGCYRLTDAEAATIAEICRHLDGLPLSIELAAARLRMMSSTELQERLGDCLNVLTNGRRTVLPRHRSLRATIDWSYALLPPPEQILFRRLSVFVGSFCLDAAVPVASGGTIQSKDVVDLLGRLVDKSLVVTVPNVRKTRYRLLETTRTFALERLIESNESRTMSHRLCVYMAHLFERAEHAWLTTPTSEWLAGLEPELDNLRAVLEWAFGTDGDPLLGLQVLGRTHWLWCELPLLREQRRWFQLGSRFVEEATPSEIEGRIHLALGWDPYFGDRSRLLAARRAETLFRRANEPIMLAQALMHVGRAASRYKDVSESMACFNEALAILRPRGPSKLFALLLLSLATCNKHAGETALARSYASDGLAMAESLGDVQTRDMSHLQLSSIAFEAGNVDEAIDIAQACIEKCKSSPFMRNRFVAAQWLAGYLIVHGEIASARAPALEAFELSRTLGNVNILDSIDQLAVIAAAEGNASLAARMSGYCDAYECQYGISRYRISLALRDRLMSYLVALSRDQLGQLRREGSNWSEANLVAAAQSLGNPTRNSRKRRRRVGHQSRV